MPRVTLSRAHKAKSKTTRRRSSVLTRAKYKPRTTTANRKLIMSNAVAIKRIRSIMPKIIYTDYQYKFGSQPFVNLSPNPFFNITNDQLMSPFLWEPVLRKDANVLESSQTMVKRMSMNLRYTLNQANWCQISTFIVTIRPDAVNRIINEANLIVNDDYIYGTDELMPRLNSQLFKVHYRRHVSLMAGAFNQPAFESAGDTLVAQSSCTLKKGQVNMTLNMKIRQPNGQTWKEMDQSFFGPSQRYFLLNFFRGQQNDPADDAPSVTTDVMYTCTNA